MQFFGCKKGGRALPAFRADGGTRRKDWIQMSQLKGACIIGQSGGPTSVINASAYGAIKTALENDKHHPASSARATASRAFWTTTSSIWARRTPQSLR